VRCVKPIEHTVTRLGWRRFEHMYGWVESCFTKLHILELPYEKVLFLDADMLCVRPGIETIFALEPPAGVLTGDDTLLLAHGAPIAAEQVLWLANFVFYASLYSFDTHSRTATGLLVRVSCCGHPRMTSIACWRGLPQRTGSRKAMREVMNHLAVVLATLR